METYPILKRSNTSNDSDVFLLKNNLNNRQSFRKKTLPKLNISNLSNSIGNFQTNSIRDRSKTFKKKITLLNVKHMDSNNLSKEIKEAKEIKDLEKIYEKWLSQEKTETKPFELLLTEEMTSSRKEEQSSNNNKNNNDENNNFFLKSKKKNISTRDSIVSKPKEIKGNDNKLLFSSSKPYKNKIKLKEIKKKEEEEKKKKELEEKAQKEEEEKRRKELEELAKKEDEERIKKEAEELAKKKEMEERAKKEEEEESEQDDMVNMNIELEEMTRKELEAVNRKEMKRKKLQEKKRKELERKKREEAEEKLKKEFEENTIKDIKDNIITELEDNMKKELEEIIRAKTEELIQIQMEETIWEEIDENKKKEMMDQMKNDLMIKMNEDLQEKISKELNGDFILELEETIKSKMNEWTKKTGHKMSKNQEEKMRKDIKEKTQREFGEKFKKIMGQENKTELEQNLKSIIEQKVKTFQENIIKEIEEKNKIELEKKEKENEERKRIEEEERIKKEAEEKKKKELEEKAKNLLNEYLKQNLDLSKNKKLKNEIANKVLSERDNISKGHNSQNNETKRKERKVNKTKDLKDIIKNADLFLSDKYKYSTSNLIKKFEYAKEIDRIIQREISENKDDNLITTDEAVYYVENNIIRFYGYFGSELIYRNINTFIEKTPNNEILREITFKILTSGLAFQKVFHITIENKELKSSIVDDERIFYKYFEELKKAISKRFQISEEDIFYFSSDIYNYEQYLLIYDTNNIEGLEDLFKSENLNFSSGLLLNNIILSPCVFEQNFCKTSNNWSKKKSRRGGWEYKPPLGWFGISMKVSKKFEKNMTWLGKQNINGEWLVAYHAIGSGNVFNRILNILDGNLKNEEIKLFKREKNTANNKNKYPLCGEGLYCSPDIQNIEKFAEKKSLGYFNIKFQFALMSRVNPNKIRNPGVYPICWIVSGNNEEIRPYRLLFKICRLDQNDN